MTTITMLENQVARLGKALGLASRARDALRNVTTVPFANIDRVTPSAKYMTLVVKVPKGRTREIEEDILKCLEGAGLKPSQVALTEYGTCFVNFTYSENEV